MSGTRPRGGGAGPRPADEDLERYLEPRVLPRYRRVFVIEAAMLRRGPLEALALARTLPPSPRNATEAAQLARIMLAAGRGRLASRYLRFCHRRWIRAPLFRDLLFASYLQCGQPDAAEGFLKRISQDQPRRAVAHLRMKLLIETGRLAKAGTVLKRQEARNPGKMKARQRLRIWLSLGQLEEAEAVLPDVKADLTGGPRVSAHFRVSQLGTMLNELRLYKLQTGAGAEAAAGAEAGPEQQAALRRTFFYPAKEAVERWVAKQPANPRRAAGPAIPRRIVQYWNAPDIPAPISQIMESWRSCPGFSHVCMNRRDALVFLRDHLGDAHVRAFRMANHVAEECDFLRLCLLWVQGGIYADADDLRIGDPDKLLAGGAGAILFTEPYGSIANNLICTRPGHPLLKIAMGMACRSLLSRENDNTWSKTGPGLMTRAVATYLDQVPRRTAIQDLSILQKWSMHPYVRPHLQLPYKSTSKYWNSLASQAARPVIDVLSAVTDASRTGPGKAILPAQQR